MQIDELPLLLKVHEAARVLRVSRNFVYDAVADGSVPSVRIGRRIRIPRQALVELLSIKSEERSATSLPQE